MYIDYNQHWDSEYRPHRHTYSHICRLRNMSVIAQLIERSNNVGETVSRPPHALLRASSAPHTCNISLWARRHPRRRMVRARGDRYDRCVRVAPQPRSSSTSSLALRYRFRTDISETPGVPSVALYHRTASAGPSGAALSYRRGAQTQIRQVHKCGKKAMNKHRRDVSSPPTTVRIAQNTL